MPDDPNRETTPLRSSGLWRRVGSREWLWWPDHIFEEAGLVVRIPEALPHGR